MMSVLNCVLNASIGRINSAMNSLRGSVMQNMTAASPNRSFSPNVKQK